MSCMYPLLSGRVFPLPYRCIRPILLPSSKPSRLLSPLAPCHLTMPKRKSLSTAPPAPAFTTAPIPLPQFERAPAPPPPKKRASGRKVSQPAPNTGSTNPDKNANVLDAPEALRASPDASEADEQMNVEAAGMDVDTQVKKEEGDASGSPLTNIESPVEQKQGARKGKPSKQNGGEANKESVVKATPATKPKPTATGSDFLDPEAEDDEEADEEELHAALSRPPPVNSDHLPLPWKGRLGYVSTSRIST